MSGVNQDLRALARDGFFEVILKMVNGATVYLDDCAAEHLRVAIGPASLIKAGAVSIHRLESPGAAGGAAVEVEQLVIIVGSELDMVRPTILEVLGQSRPSATARIFCGFTEEEQRRVSPGAPGYQQLRQECLEQLQSAGADAAVSVAPIWLGPTVVADDLFFFPQCNGEVFPSQREADVAAINVVRLLDGIDAAKETRCWSIGTGAAKVAETISAVISNEAASPTATAGSHKVNVVVVDRVLDLVGPLSQQFKSVLDRIARTIPETTSSSDRDIGGEVLLHDADADVDADSGTDDGDGARSLPTLSLLHPGEDASNFLVDSLASLGEKDGRGELRKALMQAASKAKVKLAVSAKMGKVTHKQLLEYLTPLLAGNAFVDNAALLQTVAVAVRAMDPEVIASHNLQLSAEKMMLAVAAEDDGEGLLTHLTDLVPVAKREGDAAPGEKDRTTLNFAELQSLATMAYSLGLPDFDPADEAQFRKVLENYTGGSGVAVAELFEQLARIRPVRDDLQVFNDLISPTTLEYEPLLKQIAAGIFDTSNPKLPDLVEASGAEQGSVLSQGLGLFGGMMGMSSGHPAGRCQTLVIVVLGGITCEEARAVKEIAARASKPVRIMLGGTRMFATTGSITSDLFG